MAYLSRDQIKSDVIIPALRSVSDFSADPESFNFNQFQPFHRSVFLNAIKSLLNNHPYIGNDGSIGNNWFYDVSLNPNSIDSWPTVKDCIDFVTSSHGASPTAGRSKINL